MDTRIKALFAVALLGVGCKKEAPPETMARPPEPATQHSRKMEVPMVRREAQEVTDLRRAVGRLREAPEDPDHALLVDALLATADAIEGLRGELPDDAWPAVKGLREDATGIRSSPRSSMQHAAKARSALMHTADALEAVGREDDRLGGLVERARDLRESAREVRPGEPLMDQEEAVLDALDEVVSAVEWASRRSEAGA